MAIVPQVAAVPASKAGSGCGGADESSGAAAAAEDQEISEVIVLCQDFLFREPPSVLKSQVVTRRRLPDGNH